MLNLVKVLEDWKTYVVNACACPWFANTGLSVITLDVVMLETVEVESEDGGGEVCVT